MPSGVAGVTVTEEHFFLVKRAIADLVPSGNVCLQSRWRGGCQEVRRGVVQREIGIGGSGLEAAEKSGSRGWLFVRPRP